MIAAILEIGLNIPFSLLMIKWGYNIVGVALATFVVYLISRLYLIIYVWVKMKIRPSEYIPIKIFMLYSFLLGLLFVLIDHRIIDIH